MLLKLAPLYSNAVRLQSDVHAVLRTFRTLQASSVSVSDGKLTYNLCVLHGTLPIVYTANNQQYFIPIALYFDKSYPARAPRLFVCPTPTVQIKPNHRHVENKNGVVYHSYIARWQPQSTSVDLLMQIAQAFSPDPPVFACQGGAEIPQQTQALLNAEPQQSPKDKVLETLTNNAKEKARDIFQRVGAEIDCLQKQKEELILNKVEIDSRITALGDEERKIERFNVELEQIEAKATSLIATNGDNADSIDPLKLLEPTCALSCQMLDLVAERNANTDMLFFMEDALRTKSIEPEMFLDLVRETCRSIYVGQELQKKVILAMRARQVTARPFESQPSLAKIASFDRMGA